MHKALRILLFICFTWTIYGQQQPAELDTIVLNADRLLVPFSKTQTTTTLTDSISKRQSALLTDLLRFNSTIFFKENSRGGVSSPSFRGTTAQQTAVIWNGININSQLNGQTDFNTLNTRNFEEITVRYGGGSVIYGSGAIGGTIHLNDKIEFKNQFSNELFGNIGSFNTQDYGYKTSYANSKLYAGIAVSRQSSDNDYTYDFRGQERTNLNGQFDNFSVNSQLGYKLNNYHTFKYYNYFFDGSRNFSLINPSEIPSKYEDYNTRNLLEWEFKKKAVTSVLRAAYLTERYRFYGNVDRDSYSSGNSQSWIGNYQFNLKINTNTQARFVADLNHTSGAGSNLENRDRTIGSFSFLLNQRLNKWYYEIGSRLETTKDYDSPLLFNVGISYRLFDFYTININGSRNYRIPTFNDLYWIGAGNSELNPEQSYQLEMGHSFDFENSNFKITGFYYDISNMIRWVPNSSAIWRPINTDQVVSYGLEFQANYITRWNNINFKLNGNYAYTNSTNRLTDKQLIYVPYHKATNSFHINFKPSANKLHEINTYVQTMYVGEVFFQSDNNPEAVLDSYLVSNLGMEFLPRKNWTIGLRVLNLFKVNYQSVNNRFMPGINYNFYLNLNF
ncbi:TonB-dependent receptor domain-containing protein [Nonlabens tegetincola]|uniref:TonB-dependent receptor plug domain-containing protein n=1 Tax=Nonlabens tegetincola TaxID=323273 RepID=UPI0030C7F31F